MLLPHNPSNAPSEEESTEQMRKKLVTNVCRICGRDFSGQPSSYRCPRCKKEDERYKAQREKFRRNLPYYLKADI